MQQQRAETTRDQKDCSAGPSIGHPAFRCNKHTTTQLGAVMAEQNIHDTPLLTIYVYRMIGGAFVRSVRQALFPLPFKSSCDDEELSLVQQADAAIEAKKLKIKTPMQFESLKGVLGQGHVGSYDGFRVATQKQVNLNTVISHFYWMGSQAVPQPIYQYRIILHDSTGATMLNVGSDVDFNIDGEFKAPLLDNVGLKTNFTVIISPATCNIFSLIPLCRYPSKRVKIAV